MEEPNRGQRWISRSEPGLGLGLVKKCDGQRVEILYPMVEETRIYALESAPLARVRFGPGDLVSDGNGGEFVVEQVISEGGQLTYRGGGRELREAELAATLDFVRPERRLLAGMVDGPVDFELRMRALEWSGRVRASPARGLTGGRIVLIPHQMAIVAEVLERPQPRVLLADEVGLGKTIEACLILHRLHLTGRAERVLILVPEPLIHQWFIELLRRFNLVFAIFDEERCQAIGKHVADCNPFEDSQLVICATDFLAGNEMRAEQAVVAGFDLLIVDEAHHLEWTTDDVSEEYRVVETLAEVVPALLLLTATPRQLGAEGHFARLRLLDPERYRDLAAFEREAGSHVPLARVVSGLRSGNIPGELDTHVAAAPGLIALAARLRDGDERARGTLVAGLIDLLGTGRVLFRNTRDRLPGFPQRRPELHPLKDGSSPYSWLADFLSGLPEGEKVLLITGSPDSAIEVREKLLGRIHVETALFHERLTLLQRDRNAAWFADAEGARILICSEIGSEGRNFQFASHLVLFGLPRDPEVLEQRIGRLDRIGQSGEIHIHVPHGVNDRSGMHARWLHEGLDAFSRPLKGASSLATELLGELEQLQGRPFEPDTFESFLKRCRVVKQRVAREIAEGHDLLLELGAPPPEKAAVVLEAIRNADRDTGFEHFALELFDRLGLDVSELSARSYHLHRGQRHAEVFAELPEDGASVTFDRTTALAREDLGFLTADHPWFLGSLDHLLCGETGNASFACWNTGGGKGMLLDVVFVLETRAAGRLQCERFLAPRTIRVLVDHQGRRFDHPPPLRELVTGDARRIVDQEAFRSAIFPRMLEAARELADREAIPMREEALLAASGSLDAEIRREQDLAHLSGQMSGQRSLRVTTRDQCLAAISSARPRLDALRLIWRT